MTSSTDQVRYVLRVGLAGYLLGLGCELARLTWRGQAATRLGFGRHPCNACGGRMHVGGRGTRKLQVKRERERARRRSRLLETLLLGYSKGVSKGREQQRLNINPNTKFQCAPLSLMMA